MPLSNWSTTAADNDDADIASGINWQEGQQPSTVNNSARATMAELKEFYDQVLAGTITYGSGGGTGAAYTLSTTPAPTAYSAGQKFLFFASTASTTTAPTVNIASLGAKTIKRNGSALTAGDIASGDLVEVVYDGTDMQLNGGISAGVFGSLTVSGDVTVDTDTFAVDATNNAVTIGPADYTFGGALNIDSDFNGSNKPNISLQDGASTLWHISANEANGNFYVTYGAAPGTAAFRATGAGNFLVPSGSLGINTTSPDTPLEVIGTTQIKSADATTANALINLGGDGTNIGARIAYTQSTDLLSIGTSHSAYHLNLAANGGVYTTNATGGSQGADTINASGYYVDGVSLTAGSMTELTSVTLATASTFDSIPSSAVEVKLVIVGMSCDGGEDLLFRLGDSGGIEISGYTHRVRTFSGGSNSTTGFQITNGAGALETHSGQITLTKVASNTWMVDSQFMTHGGGGHFSNGYKATSGTLTQGALVWDSGGAFDAGTCTVYYQ